MGKDLRGKELGKGIVQRKDKMYSARFTNRNGKRIEKLFSTAVQAKKWLAEAKYEDAHSTICAGSSMTVDAWFDYWFNNIVADRADNTRRNYRERYTINVRPLLGRMLLSDVKQMHCWMVLNKMKQDGYAQSTIYQTYIALGALLKSAKVNDLISKHPMDGIKNQRPLETGTELKCFTIEEQQKFADAAKNTKYYAPFALALETGLRPGEIIGLTWDMVDFENKTLTVNKSVEYRYSTGVWQAGPPKTITSYRTIPLTKRAMEILKKEKEGIKKRKKSDILSKTLSFTDDRMGISVSFKIGDLVFINQRTGEPTKNSTYDTRMYKVCDKAKIRHISMHGLRHTYATRAIERGMQPKILQKLLGHSSIKITMDKYVHVTEDSFADAIRLFEEGSDK